MEENNLDDLLDIEVPATAPSVEEEPVLTQAAPAKKTRKKPEPSQPAKVSENITVGTENTDDRVRIIIDQVKGMSNYETVGVNGRIYQIKRGEPVWVPQEVVNVLQDAVMTDTIITRHPITGERVEEVRHFSAIPWRRA